MRSKFYPFLYVGLLLLTISCSKPNNYSNPNTEIIREFRVNTSTLNQNHVVNENQSFSQFLLQVYGDTSTVRFDIFADSIRANDDYLTGVELRLGDPITENGTLLMAMPGKFPGPSGTGILSGLRRSFVDTLLNDKIDKYVNVLTKKHPTGYLRGQLNTNIIFTQQARVLGSNIIPGGVTTVTNGVAYIRLVEETKKLYSKIDLENDETSDPAISAKLNIAATGLNGPNLLTLISSATEFGKPRSMPLSDEIYAQFLSNNLYLTVTSPNYPNGKIRAQIK
jgi:hypothetical protein